MVQIPTTSTTTLPLASKLSKPMTPKDEVKSFGNQEEIKVTRISLKLTSVAAENESTQKIPSPKQKSDAVAREDLSVDMTSMSFASREKSKILHRLAKPAIDRERIPQREPALVEGVPSINFRLGYRSYNTPATFFL